MANEYDLRIENGDLAFEPDDEPLFLADVHVVAQDVKHLLLESGLGPELVADDQDPASVLERIAFEVEEDRRIRPGSARAESSAPGAYVVIAETMDGAAIEQQVSP